MNYLQNSTHIGDIEESVAIAEFTKIGAIPLLPISDNLPYDLAIDIQGNLYKIQVKTVQCKRDSGYYLFYTERLNGFTHKATAYSESEIDYIYVLKNLRIIKQRIFY